VNFQVEDPRPVGRARLAVPQKANVAFVQLSTAVITVSLERGKSGFKRLGWLSDTTCSSMRSLDYDTSESLYQQSTIFKDPVHNPIIGVGFDRRPMSSRTDRSHEGNLRLTAFAPRSGFLGVEVDPVRLFDYEPR
jgi:hypothetical protein